jgi:hypothetical protein
MEERPGMGFPELEIKTKEKCIPTFERDPEIQIIAEYDARVVFSMSFPTCETSN